MGEKKPSAEKSKPKELTGIGETMRKTDCFTLIWLIGWVLLSVVLFFYFSHIFEEFEYFPDFIKGLTSAVGINVAVIVFLLTSISREQLEEITTTRIYGYLFGIFFSLGMIIISYLQMIARYVAYSLFAMMLAFAVVFIVLLNLMIIYMDIKRQPPKEKG